MVTRDRDAAPKVSFLVSTIGRRPDGLASLLEDLQRQTLQEIEVVVVLQVIDEADLERIELIVAAARKRVEIRLVVSRTIGVSKNRNIALAEGRGRLLVLCDDDCRYPADAAEVVWTEALSRSDWDLITFKVGSSEGRGEFRRYPESALPHSLRTVMSVCMIEIALRRRIVEQTPGGLFDERIGHGTRFITGAENILLVDLLKAGYKAGFCPKTIVCHPDQSSGHGAAPLDRLLFSKAVMFRRMFGGMGILPAVWFYLRRLFPGKPVRFSIKHWHAFVEGLAVRLE